MGGIFHILASYRVKIHTKGHYRIEALFSRIHNIDYNTTVTSNLCIPVKHTHDIVVKTNPLISQHIEKENETTL